MTTEMAMMPHRPVTREQAIQLRRDLLEIAEPYVKLKVDVLNRTAPKLIIHPDGCMDTIYPDDVTEFLAAVDEQLKEAQDHYIAMW